MDLIYIAVNTVCSRWVNNAQRHQRCHSPCSRIVRGQIARAWGCSLVFQSTCNSSSTYPCVFWNANIKSNGPPSPHLAGGFTLRCVMVTADVVPQIRPWVWNGGLYGGRRGEWLLTQQEDKYAFGIYARSSSFLAKCLDFGGKGHTKDKNLAMCKSAVFQRQTQTMFFVSGLSRW